MSAKREDRRHCPKAGEVSLTDNMDLRDAGAFKKVEMKAVDWCVHVNKKSPISQSKDSPSAICLFTAKHHHFLPLFSVLLRNTIIFFATFSA